MTTHRAQCSCGQLTVTCTGAPIRVAVCHCFACKQKTGSAFGFSAWFTENEVRVEGEATEWLRVGDEGSRMTRRFCSVCGSTVYGTNDHLPGLISISAGCFADLDFPPPPTASVYHETRRYAWVELRCEPLSRN